MLNKPKTRAEARAWYPNDDCWLAYDCKRCAYPVRCHNSVLDSERQCFYNPGHGPGKLYCKHHAGME